MFTELTGLEYIKADIACLHDKSYEKKTFQERLDYHDNEYVNLSINPLDGASNPIGLKAVIEAYNDTLTNKPSGYMISLDACSSGLQILSLLVSCPKSWDLCGGISNKCVDSYMAIYDSMNLNGSITRKKVKQTIMTSLYGSTAMPEMTFGNKVDAFYKTMENMAPGAWNLNLALQDLWEDMDTDTYDWVMPDNFHCQIETQVKKKISFNFLDDDYELTVKESGRPDFHKGLGPNLIHSEL